MSPDARVSMDGAPDTVDLAWVWLLALNAIEDALFCAATSARRSGALRPSPGSEWYCAAMRPWKSGWSMPEVVHSAIKGSTGWRWREWKEGGGVVGLSGGEDI